MTAQEAYEIVKKEFPGMVAYSCLEFEEVFGFLLTDNPDGEELLGVAYRTVDKKTGKIGFFYPTMDFKKFLASKKIDVKTFITQGGTLMRNPVSDKWYADPESRVYGDTVYMYVTNSLPFEQQKNLDVVTTRDLEHFEEHRNILDMSTFRGADFAIWAPTVIDKDGKYYIIFAANDIHEETEIGGLYIGVCDSPLGPFKNVFADGRPLLNRIYNRAQPIDAHLFKDDDGAVYLYYGGWGHLMVCRMNEKMDGFLPMAAPCLDGVVRELTPEKYVEAPYILKMGGKYHLMYSSGNWTNGTYCVKAAVADHPCGEFVFYGDILHAAAIADGPGHNSAFCFKGKHYTAYHRRTVGDGTAHHRKLCIDELSLDGDKFNPVTMT